jgi:hypothetical protein
MCSALWQSVTVCVLLCSCGCQWTITLQSKNNLQSIAITLQRRHCASLLQPTVHSSEACMAFRRNSLPKIVSQVLVSSSSFNGFYNTPHFTSVYLSSRRTIAHTPHNCLRAPTQTPAHRHPTDCVLPKHHPLRLPSQRPQADIRCNRLLRIPQL